MLCSKCGAKVSRGKFCNSCGALFHRPKPVSAAPRPVEMAPRADQTPQQASRTPKRVPTRILATAGALVATLFLGVLVTHLAGQSPSNSAGNAPAQAPSNPASPAQVSAAPASVSQPAPSPTPNTTLASNLAIVANTDGQGAYIRRSPSAEDKMKAWSEETLMLVVGDDLQAEGRLWANVMDPDGNRGWVPVDYLVSAPTGTLMLPITFDSLNDTDMTNLEVRISGAEQTLDEIKSELDRLNEKYEVN